MDRITAFIMKVEPRTYFLVTIIILTAYFIIPHMVPHQITGGEIATTARPFLLIIGITAAPLCIITGIIKMFTERK